MGSVCAMDAADPKSVICPGGVGVDIGCGTRLLTSVMTEHDIAGALEQLQSALSETIPVGPGTSGCSEGVGEGERQGRRKGGREEVREAPPEGSAPSDRQWTEMAGGYCRYLLCSLY